jgi:hypothetical protein
MKVVLLSTYVIQKEKWFTTFNQCRIFHRQKFAANTIFFVLAVKFWKKKHWDFWHILTYSILCAACRWRFFDAQRRIAAYSNLQNAKQKLFSNCTKTKKTKTYSSLRNEHRFFLFQMFFSVLSKIKSQRKH